MDDEQTQSVSRMKEIVSMIVTRRAKISSTRRELIESVWLQARVSFFFLYFYMYQAEYLFQL